MATLVLLRHAKAEPHGSGGADFDRPLSLRGRHQAGGLGGLLTAHDAVPQVVLCSAAVRAAQTWQLAAVGLPEGIEVAQREDMYGADADELLDLLHAVPDRATRVLVVGHEPVISHLARVLAGPGSEDAAMHRVGAGMSTAMCAFLQVDQPWAELERRGAVLTGLDRPEE